MKFGRILMFGLACFFVGCGGGGGGTTQVLKDEVGNGESENWELRAEIVNDGCGERTSPVRQIVVFKDNLVDTGIISVARTVTDLGFNFGYSERNGDCERHYLAEFRDVDDASAKVQLSSLSNCTTVVCENKWSGVASRVAE